MQNNVSDSGRPISDLPINVGDAMQVRIINITSTKDHMSGQPNTQIDLSSRSSVLNDTHYDDEVLNQLRHRDP
jgi:hypothetical protein